MSVEIIRLSIGGKMRIFEAICETGKVYIHNGTVEVPNVKILSEGGDSEGILLMANGELIYVAQVSSDLKNALIALKNGFTKLASDVTVASGGSVDTGGATANFASDMNQVATDLNTIIGSLK